MAVNVLSVKYPYLNYNAVSADEISAIDPGSAVLSGKGAETVRRFNGEIETATAAVKNLKSLDLQIAQLMHKRMRIVDDMHSVIGGLMHKVFSVDVEEAEKISNEFQNEGFTEKVRSFVKSVRDMLFDDSRDEYRSILCVGVMFDMYDHKIDCDFECASNGNCFKVLVPVLYEYDCDFFKDRNRFGRGSGDIATVDVVFPYNPSHSLTVISHFDIRVIRQQLDNFVARGCLPIEDSGKKCIRCRYYSESEKPMDIYDYYEEAK